MGKRNLRTTLLLPEEEPAVANVDTAPLKATGDVVPLELDEELELLSPPELEDELELVSPPLLELELDVLLDDELDGGALPPPPPPPQPVITKMAVSKSVGKNSFLNKEGAKVC
jgi:hypothetical protein